VPQTDILNLYTSKSRGIIQEEPVDDYLSSLEDSVDIPEDREIDQVILPSNYCETLRKYTIHPAHILEYHSSLDNNFCDVCKNHIFGAAYRCNDCDYDICIECAKIQPRGELSDTEKSEYEEKKKAKKIQEDRTNNPKLAKIMDMGFDYDLASRVLKQYGNLELVIDAMILPQKDNAEPIIKPNLLIEKKIRKKSTRPGLKTKKPTKDQIEAFSEILSKDPSPPVAFLDLRKDIMCIAPTKEALQAKYFHFVCVSKGHHLTRLPPSLSYVSLVGYNDETRPIINKDIEISPSLSRPLYRPNDFIEIAKTVKFLPIIKSCFYDPNDPKTGILYWFATALGKSSWLNPVSRNLVNIDPVNLQILCSYGSKVAIPTEIRTNNNTATLIFKFNKYKIMVTSYVLVNGTRKCHLRPVLLEGGSDDGHWSVIHDEKLRQSHEESIPRETLLIECPSNNAFFSSLRFTFPGRSVNLLAIEYFGIIMESII